MKVFGRERIDAFSRENPKARKSVEAWRLTVEANTFTHFAELKRIFGSADYVRPYTVFDIGGNKYRLIGLIDYELEIASVENILTHSEYDKGKWRARL